jgi:hypothetical protein
MSNVVVRYQTKPERAEENQALIERVFAGLNDRQPEGLRYASFRLVDGVTFVHVASVETADGTNPLSELPAFAEFVKGIADRVQDGPTSSEATVVGSYRFFG